MERLWRGRKMCFDLTSVGLECAEELIELRMAYLAADFGELSPKDEASIRAALPSYFERHLGRDLTAFVARAEDGRIASVALLLVGEKPANPRFVNGRIGTVFNVYTVPEFRRRGLASQVMGKLVAFAREQALDLVELNATDEGYPLYRSLGFADAILHRPMSIKP